MDFVKANILQISSLNVRKTIDPKALQSLKASILAHGVMQNLLITKDNEVIAGGMRLRAVQELIKEGALIQDYVLPCIMVKDDHQEKSLAENTVRQSMHPADEFEAYRQLVDAGVHSTDIALRFGVTERHVLQRLRMARLDKKILNAFRDGKITLPMVMGFTISDDKKKQLEVLKEVIEERGEYQSEYDADDIKRMLMDEAVSPDDKLLKFVGVEAYEAAGGKCNKDLFSEDVYVTDVVLLEKLARDKLKPHADKIIKAGWKWALVVVGDTYEETKGMGRAYGELNKEQKALMGCVIRVGYKGEISVDEGYYRKEDAVELKKMDKKGDVSMNTEPAKGKVKGELTNSMVESLKAQRRQIMQAALAKHPTIIINLMLYAAVDGILNKAHYETTHPVEGLDVRFNQQWESEEAKKTIAARIMKEQLSTLDLNWKKIKNPVERMTALCELPNDKKMGLLAYCVASCVEKGLAGTRNLIEYALSLTGEEASEYWRPTADNYLNGVTRETLVAIGGEIFGKKWADEHANDKKGELVKMLDKAFADPKKASAGNLQVQQELEAWMPKEMRFSEIARDKKKGRAA